MAQLVNYTSGCVMIHYFEKKLLIKEIHDFNDVAEFSDDTGAGRQEECSTMHNV